MLFMFVLILKIISIVVPLLMSVAYFTMAESKIMSSMQSSSGPNFMGFLGLLQPFADGLKLFVKETTLPTSANTSLFLFSPALSFMLSLVGWAVMPLSKGMVICDMSLGVFYLLTISSLNVYAILFAGWSSNSKYPFLGAMSSTAQMLSYEVSMSFMILNVVLCAGSFNFSNIVFAQQHTWFVMPLLPIFMIFYMSMLAETNSHPFDLPEAEAELVSGYNVEYSAMTFALFFLGEYANMLMMSSVSAILFLGGWLSPLFSFMPSFFWLSLKIVFGVIFFIVTSATLPSYRYDQLMNLGWKSFLPMTLGYFLFSLGILIGFNLLPC